MNFTTIIRFFLIIALISSCDNKSKYKSYYQDGKLKLEGNYIDEKRYGVFNAYGPTEDKYSINIQGFYTNGNLDSLKINSGNNILAKYFIGLNILEFEQEQDFYHYNTLSKNHKNKIVKDHYDFYNESGYNISDFESSEIITRIVYNHDHFRGLLYRPYSPNYPYKRISLHIPIDIDDYKYSMYPTAGSLVLYKNDSIAFNRWRNIINKYEIVGWLNFEVECGRYLNRHYYFNKTNKYLDSGAIPISLSKMYESNNEELSVYDIFTAFNPAYRISQSQSPCSLENFPYIVYDNKNKSYKLALQNGELLPFFELNQFENKEFDYGFLYNFVLDNPDILDANRDEYGERSGWDVIDDEKKELLIMQILDENFPEFLDFNLRH